MKRSTLSMQLYRRVLLLLALTALAIGAVLYFFADREISRAADVQLIDAARLLDMMMQDEFAQGVLVRRDRVVDAQGDPLLTTEDERAFQATYDSYMFTVFWNGKLVARSGWGAPVRLLPLESGLHTFTAQGDSWRSYGMRNSRTPLLIVVAQRHAMRDFSLGPVLAELAVPMLLLLGLSMLVLWATLRKSLSQVERLASTINARSLADLEPLEPEVWPIEMEPLVVALNKLFARLEGAYDLEQAFTDDVAHELRTPLAAIRAQAQVLRRLAPRAVGQDVDRLTSTVDRANNLIDGMLMLARLNATTVAPRSVDVHGLVAEVVADAMIEAGPDGIECSVVPEHIVRWQCDAALLQVALSAVIGNAIRHARTGGQLDIALARGSDQLVVSVADRGPGIPAAERERLLRRFEHGALPTAGSGLGLSIASKAMTLLGGTIRLEERPDGAGLLAVLTLRSQAS